MPANERPLRNTVRAWAVLALAGAGMAREHLAERCATTGHLPMTAKGQPKKCHTSRVEKVGRASPRKCPIASGRSRPFITSDAARQLRQSSA